MCKFHLRQVSLYMHENYSLLGCEAAPSGTSGPTLYNSSAPIIWTKLSCTPAPKIEAATLKCWCI